MLTTHPCHNAWRELLRVRPGVTRAAALSTLLGLAVVAGCASEGPVINAGTLTPGDFVTGGQYVVVAVAPRSAPSRAGTSGPAPQPMDINRPGVAGLPAGVDVVGPATAAAGVGPTVGTPGAPVLSEGETPRVGLAQFVDARVGDINGKPIFASQFFDKDTPTTLALGVQLSQNAALVRQRKMTADAWRADASRQIALTLKGLVQDELFRAEAVASLTPQQRQGLFSFLEGLQENLRRESGGSREAARRRIEEEGLTTEEYLQRQEALALIGEQLHNKVTRRVNVTWRDISQAYNGRMYEKYNPPVRYNFRLIIVDGADDAAKAEVQAQLASGKPFAQVAAMPLNGSRAATGGMQSPREIQGDVKDIKFFPNADLDDAAHSLAAGETAGPIKVGTQVAWVNFDSIENEKKSIYDAQLEIYSTIFNDRLSTEQNKYYNQLLSHASVTSLIEMQNRLLQIAEERYLRGGVPRAPR